jgi:hypothetical protein
LKALLVSFAALEKEQDRTKTLAVVNWLSAADPHIDQEAFAATRHDIPDTGRWILEEPMIKDWTDPCQRLTPIIWLKGKPGAGQLSLLISLHCHRIAL